MEGIVQVNITDVDGKWKLTPYQIENRKTGEIRRLDRTPNVNTLVFMPYRKFMIKCQQAFNTGIWPRTYWASGKVTD